MARQKKSSRKPTTTRHINTSGRIVEPPSQEYIPSRPALKVNCKFKNKKQKDLYNTILDNRITLVRSVAGVGKTYVALAAALEIIKDQAFNIDQIFLTKPIVEITSGKGLGFLPGDAKEKSSIHYCHFYDNLTKLVGKEGVRWLTETGVIKEVLLNYIRGTTFGRYDQEGNPVGSIVIFDEAQNCTVGEMKSFISRMGEGTKIVILGDSEQIDIRLYDKEKCGLDDAIDRLYGMDNVGYIEFNEDDIVRDKFLIEIMKRYKS